MANPVPFLIRSVMFPDYCLVAGDTADNKVYFQKPGERANAQWVFEPAPDEGYYLLRDTKHGKFLVAGEHADNNLYHQDNGDRTVARWKVIQKTEDNSTGLIFLDDQQHFAMACGLKNDGHVYHQDLNNSELKTHPNAPGVPPQRKCMLWNLEPAKALSADDDIPQPFLEYAGKVIKVVWDEPEQVIDNLESAEIVSIIVKNIASIPTECYSEETKEVTENFEVSFGHTVTNKFASGIAIEIGGKGGSDKAQGQGKVGYKNEKDETASDSVGKTFTKETSTSLKVGAKASLGPGESVTVDRTIYIQKRQRKGRAIIRIPDKSGHFDKEINVHREERCWVVKEDQS